MATVAKLTQIDWTCRLRIIAILIGRAGSSMRNKNLVPVLGHPILHWTAQAARNSTYISEFYVSSDSDQILGAGALAGYLPVKRDASLATDDAKGADVVASVISSLKFKLDLEHDIVVLQHANCATITTELIDLCIEELLKDPSLSAVLPAHIDQDHHPYRAKGLDNNFITHSHFPDLSDLSSNRQELPQNVFFDHSIWVVRGKHFISRDGEAPWKELGPRVKVILTEGSHDIHVPEDVAATENWLLSRGINPPNFQ